MNDIHETARQYPSLSVSVASHVNEKGVRQRLVCLGGTLPIVFRNSSYSLPLRIWVMTYYPAGPPIAVLEPNESMLLNKRHKNVDSLGKVYMQELASWDPLRSSISPVVSRMETMFSQEPPLYTRPAGAKPPSRRPNSSHLAAPDNAQPSHSSQQSGQVTPQQSGRLMPEQSAQEAPQRSGRVTPHHGDRVSPQQSNPVETPSPHPMISSEQERQHLMHIFTARTQQYLSAITESALAESAQLGNELREIRNGEVALEDARRQLLAAKKSHEGKITAVRAAYDALRSKMDEANMHEGDVPVDRIIMTDPYTWQVVECVALDAAHQDALDAVSDALADNAIDFATFMKETKRLSRELFAVRALKLKIRRKQAQLRPNQGMSALFMSASQV